MGVRSEISRDRFIYAAAVVVVIAAGLASRRFPDLLPAFLGKYPGDALWALMVFLALGFMKPRWPSAFTAGLALTISFAVEFSQMYQAPWINSLRDTTLGHLVLGTTFGWYDLAAYAAGVLAGYVADIGLHGRDENGKIDVD